ncbi:hypothetical protein [Streptomyces sp. NPDC006640]|uniref:hypothetical protein n=1 Tax=unclassified Streptomyces TaxID=2593676 RepID=UPI0036BB0F84
MDDAGRYHLHLTLPSGRGQHGWWDERSTAVRQFRSWVGERGRAGTRITLTDTADGTVIHRWPDET